MLKMSELNLLMECLSTEGEAEDGGVKYIFMDDNTVYRFENNRMKKVSKALITKAKKQIQSQNNLNQIQSQSNEESEKPKPSKRSKKTTKPIPEPINDDEEEEEEENEVLSYAKPEPIHASPKRSKSKVLQPQPRRTKMEQDFSSAIDLNEYYNNKNRMEFMNLEITRLNNKVDKLKQYKAIVNKLTGNEFDFDAQNTLQPHLQTQPQTQPQRNDSLFLY